MLETYSSAPNNRADPNKRAGRKIQSIIMNDKIHKAAKCCSEYWIRPKNVEYVKKYLKIKLLYCTVVDRGDKIDFDFLTFLTDLQSIVILMKGFTNLLAFFALFNEKNVMSKMLLLSISPKVSHFAS